MLLANTAEGTSGATVATTDTGTGDAFDTVNIGSGHTITYDSTRTRGSGATSIKHAASGTSTGGYMAWTSTSVGAAVGTAYVRFYLWWDTLPNVDVRLATVLGAASVRCAIRIITGNFLRITDSGGGAAVTTTTALSASTWYRVEAQVIGSATVGQVEIKLFSGDSTTALDTQTSGATLNTGGTIDAIRFGNTVPALSQTYWTDDLAITDTGYLGPTVPPVVDPLRLPIQIIQVP